MSTTPNDPARFMRSRTQQSLVSALERVTLHRHLYLTAAQRCEDAGLHVVAHAFRFTAAQEKEHADIFRGLLRTFGGEQPAVTDAEEAPPHDAPLTLLHTAAQSEARSCGEFDPGYADIAVAEHYPRIATAFRRIAGTEQLHARRFSQYAQALQDGSLFSSSRRVGWLCLPCGHLHYGSDAPEHCGSCGRSRGHFIRSDFHPFTVAT